MYRFMVFSCRVKFKQMHHIYRSTHVFATQGFKTEGLPPAVWKGGESEALERLNKHLDRKVNKILFLYIYI